MGLNLKGLLLATALVLGGVTLVQANDQIDRGYHTITGVTVSEITRATPLSPEKLETIYEKTMDVRDIPEVDPIGKVGRVISIARDLVALGEEIYRLVEKNKPSNTTTYAPISVIPRINGKAVDILDTERWRAPVKRAYQVVYKNAYNAEVVIFRFSVMYSYGGSYDGKGAYLAAVQIIPDSVRTLWGWTFTATMKLGGIVNQGTRAYPVAGATLLLEYTVNSLLVANNQTVTFFVNGQGGFKKY